MHERKLLKIRAMAMPLLVAGLLIPGALGTLVAGPGLGLLFAEGAVIGLVVYAALQKPDVPIEVVASADGRRRILVLITEDISRDPKAVESLVSAIEPIPADDPQQILVLAPARSGALSEWLSDTEPGRDRAQVRLVHSVAALAAAGVEAEAQVGDADALQALEDTLRFFGAGEVVAVTGDDSADRAGAKAFAAMERRLEVPLTRIVATPTADASRA